MPPLLGSWITFRRPRWSYTPAGGFVYGVDSVMTLRTVGFIASLALGLLAAPFAADAQQAGRIPRIGLLRVGSPPDALAEAFRQGLRDSATLRGRTSPSSTDGRRGSPIGSPNWRPSSSG